MSKSHVEHCSDIGVLGGKSKSKAKQAAARANLAKARRAKAANESYRRQAKAVKAAEPWYDQVW